MKRELIESYYEAHMSEIQESAKTQEIRELDKEIRRLDDELCGMSREQESGLWKIHDRIMDLTNAYEDDMFKELYIYGFLDYERLVLGHDRKDLETGTSA